MQLPHVTLRDEELTHQVHMFTINAEVNISCNCRRVTTSTGHHVYQSMGPSVGIVESRKLYNNPENHKATFSKEDEAKW